MVRDAVRSYLGLAAGIGTLTRQRAVSAARALASSGEATAEQVSALADDLVATSKANREAVAGLVRVEVERALARLGLATAEDVRMLTARLAAVENRVRSDLQPAPPAGAGAKSQPKAQPSSRPTKGAKTGAGTRSTARRTSPPGRRANRGGAS